MRIVFFDLETGGLEPGVHPIIEFAAIAVSIEGGEWKIAGELDMKLAFDESVCSPQALEINGFYANRSAWDAAIPEKIAMNAIAGFFREHATVPMTSKGGRSYKIARLAGHNIASFDVKFLQAWFRSWKEFLPAHYVVLDTMHLAAWKLGHLVGVNGGIPDLKLGTLGQYLKIERQGDAHTALSDVRVNVDVAAALCRLTPVNFGGIG